MNAHMIGKSVLVRTVNAGVHYGRLAAHEGGEVLLHAARRIWRWDGTEDADKPYTLSEVSQIGPGSRARVSQTIPEILVREAIEIIPCSERAVAAMEAARWAA